MTLIACQLLNGVSGNMPREERTRFIHLAARTALRDKIHLNEVSQRTADEVIDEIAQGLAAEWRGDDKEFWELGSPERQKKKTGENLRS